jgi:hypothetical protein
LVLAALAAVTLAPAAANAELPQRGTLVIGAERLTGFYSFSYKHQVDGGGNNTVVDETDSGTQINLLWGNGALGLGGPPNISAIPRIGVDYLLTDILTLGGSAGLFTSSGTANVSQNNVTVSNNLPSVTAFALAPRVGAAIHLSEQWTLWPRGGVTYASAKVEQDTPLPNNGGTETQRHTYSQLLLSLEAMIVYSPVPHLGFSLGPIFELPMSGSDTYEHIRPQVGNNPAVDTSVSYDAKLQNLGVVFGILGYL